MAIQFTAKQRARFEEHAVMAAYWYLNNQNTDERPWGGMRDSADNGRYVYERIIHRDFARGAGVWAQAMGIMNLLDLGEADGGWRFKDSALLGARYLESLQVMDFRYPKSIGAFYEHVPVTCDFSYPRDGATGAFALCSLYKYTKDEKWLEAAKLFADWWINNGTDEKGWPYISFDIFKEEGNNLRNLEAGEEGAEIEEYVKGDWQAGAGLFFYQLYKLTKDERYLKEGFDPLVNRLFAIYDENRNKPVEDGFHGEVPISYGNDDFALVALIAAYKLYKKKEYLDLIIERIQEQNQLMDEDGSYPSLGGTFVCGISNLEFIKLVETENLKFDVSSAEACVKKTAEFGMTLQVRGTKDLDILGGVYGQSSYGVTESYVHHRSTGYSLNFYHKLFSKSDVPTFSAFGWD